MFQGNESISTYSKSNGLIWMTMAFQAGLINIGGFMACAQFVSHVTGYATLFAYEASQFRFSHAIALLLVPIFFLLGSMLSGQLIYIRVKQHKIAKYYLAFGAIFLLMCVVFFGGISGQFGVFGEPLLLKRDYLLLALLCMVCGIQNGTVTTVSRAVIRTTHLTGVTTDLGLGIMKYLNRNNIPGGIGDEVKANYMRLGIILFFCAGSSVGVIAFKLLKYGGFVIPVVTSGMLFLIAFYFQVVRKIH